MAPPHAATAAATPSRTIHLDRHLDRLRTLWPPDPSGRSSGTAAAGVVLLVTAVTLGRLWGASPLDTVWAEDGTVFVSQQRLTSFGEALGTPYGGYLHLVPRVLTALTALLPLEWTAAALRLAAAVVLGLLVLVVERALRGHLLRPGPRWAVAAALPLLPLGRETLANVANLHWYLLFTALVVLLWDTRRSSHQLVGCLVVVGAALSDPFGALLLVVAVGRVAVLRTWHSTVVPAALVAAAAVQTVVVLSSGQREAQPQTNPVRLVQWLVERLLGSLGLGEELGRRGHAAGLLGAGLLIVLVIAPLWLRRRLLPAPTRTLAGFALACSAAAYLVPVGLSGIATNRYAVVPALCLVLCAGACADGLLRRGRLQEVMSDRVVRVAVLGSAGLACLAVLTSLPAAGAQTGQARWSRDLQQARTGCASTSGSVQVPIRPDNWSATLPCRALVPTS